MCDKRRPDRQRRNFLFCSRQLLGGERRNWWRVTRCCRFRSCASCCRVCSLGRHQAADLRDLIGNLRVHMRQRSATNVSQTETTLSALACLRRYFLAPPSIFLDCTKVFIAATVDFIFVWMRSRSVSPYNCCSCSDSNWLLHWACARKECQYIGAHA